MLNPVLLRMLQQAGPEFFQKSQPVDPELAQRRNFELPVHQPPAPPQYAPGGSPQEQAAVNQRLAQMEQQGKTMDPGTPAWIGTPNSPQQAPRGTPKPQPQQQGWGGGWGDSIKGFMSDPARMALLSGAINMASPTMNDPMAPYSVGGKMGEAFRQGMGTYGQINKMNQAGRDGGFTLSPGQVRYGPRGNKVAGVPGLPGGGYTIKKDPYGFGGVAQVGPDGKIVNYQKAPKGTSGRVPKSDLVDGHVIVADGKGGYQAKKVINLPEGVDGKEVKRSDILDDGSAVLVFKDGSTGVRDRNGKIATGEDRLAVLEGALDFSLRKTRLTAGEKEAGSSAIKQSVEFFKQVSGIESQLGLYDEALAQLPEAGTGPIVSLFPTIRDASVQLQNIQAQLGLNVIQRTTFGSLSEAELEFALSSALPTRLDESSLADWLGRKKIAQQKLSNYIQNAAVYLGTPGNTIAGWVSMQQKAQKERGNKSEGMTDSQRKRLEALRKKQGR